MYALIVLEFDTGKIPQGLKEHPKFCFCLEQAVKQ